jgi:hypothetical protein
MKPYQNYTYAEAYRAWVESLPPAERASLAAAGLDQPDDSYRTSTWHYESALNQPCDGSFTHPTSNPPEAEGSRAAVEEPSRVADALAAFCARVRAHPNPLLALDTLCFATGLMGVEGQSQTDLARRHKVTRSAFSKLVVGWIDLFDLTPPRGCRSLRARRAYSLSRHASVAMQREAKSR